MQNENASDRQIAGSTTFESNRSGNGLIMSRAVQLCQNVSNGETLRLLHLL